MYKIQSVIDQIGKPFILDFKVICVADDKHLAFPKGKLTKGKICEVVLLAKG
jgi:hypothetical protein